MARTDAVLQLSIDDVELLRPHDATGLARRARLADEASARP